MLTPINILYPKLCLSFHLWGMQSATVPFHVHLRRPCLGSGVTKISSQELLFLSCASPFPIFPYSIPLCQPDTPPASFPPLYLCSPKPLSESPSCGQDGLSRYLRAQTLIRVSFATLKES